MVLRWYDAAMGNRQLAFTSRDADRIRGGMVISLAAC